MLLKENPTSINEKTAAAAPPPERAGVKTAHTAHANAAGTSGVAGAAEGRAPSANAARPSYVPTRRRSRRNLLL